MERLKALEQEKAHSAKLEADLALAKSQAAAFQAALLNQSAEQEKVNAAKMEADLALAKSQAAAFQAALLSQNTVHQSFLHGLEGQMRMMAMTRNMTKEQLEETNANKRADSERWSGGQEPRVGGENCCQRRSDPRVYLERWHRRDSR